MATPHRGLPPPAAMNLPDPTRPLTAAGPGLGQPLGPMPAPPNQWQGHEDSMRTWLAAKAEEDKRKQEEERTRQESLRLEQRRIEQSMLRESLQAGVPPHMVPIIYAGIGGSALTHMSVEYLHQYAAQIQLSQQQVQPASPEGRQRMIGQAAYQAPVMQQYTTEGAVPVLPSQARAPTSAPRSIAQSQLPRLTTNDVFVNQPPPPNPGSAHPLQQSQTVAQEGAASSPNIYFHHWVPPNEAKNPSTPVTKGRRDEEPSSAHPGSHHSDNDEPRHRDSPRKRKAQGGHQPQPPPSSAPQYGSPSFSTASSASGRRTGGHQRNRSTASFKDEIRPDSRKEELHRLSFQPPMVREEVAREPERRTEEPYTASAAEPRTYAAVVAGTRADDVAATEKEGSRTSSDSQRPPRSD